MVKVIGLDQSEVKRITCKNCASILEYTQNEVLITSGTDYGGGSCGSHFLNCPTCSKKVIIKSW